MNTLVLTEENIYRAELADGVSQSETPAPVARRLSGHTWPMERPCLAIRSGARVVFPPLLVEAPSRCLLSVGAGHARIHPDGLALRVYFVGSKGGTQELHRHRIDAFDPDEPWHELEIDLTPTYGDVGEFALACDHEGEIHSGSDSIVVYEFVVSPRDEFGLNRARAFAEFRAKNELAAFATVYDHALFNAGDTPRATHPIRTLMTNFRRWLGSGRAPAVSVEPANPAQSVGSATPPLQNVYDYYTTQILERLGITNVVFRSYLERKLATLDRPIRILSLASGAARIEEGLIDGIDAERIELVLTDLNPSLLSTARARLAHRARLETIELNLNQLTLPSRRFDVVVCVSALHHVVELEQLFAQVAASLLEDGEFWSIGEYIGRNGTRLYPEAYSIANDFFQALPEHYRVNRNPGGRGGVDDRLPNLDCSATCFEGIRSEEIVPLMDRYFAPVEVMKFDCFLWRLFNLAYFDNYDLGREEDLALVHSAIDLEEEFARAGGQPTAMHGVFRLQDERSAGS